MMLPLPNPRPIELPTPRAMPRPLLNVSVLIVSTGWDSGERITSLVTGTPVLAWVGMLLGGVTGYGTVSGRITRTISCARVSPPSRWIAHHESAGEALRSVVQFPDTCNEHRLRNRSAMRGLIPVVVLPDSPQSRGRSAPTTSSSPGSSVLTSESSDVSKKSLSSRLRISTTV